MVAIAVAATGLGLYALAVAVSPLMSVLLVILILATLGPFVLGGVLIRERNPMLSSVLVQGWSPLAILLVGGISALLIFAGSVLISGPDAPREEAAIIGAGGGIVTLIATGATKSVEGRLSPWFCYTIWSGTFRAMFPCRPLGTKGQDAWEAVSLTCTSFQTSQWSFPAVRHLLTVIKSARDVGQYEGGSDWECPDPSATG